MGANPTRRRIKRLMAQAWRNLDDAERYVAEVWMAHSNVGNERAEWFAMLGQSIVMCKGAIEAWWQAEVSDNPDTLMTFR
jgi:hypothetical protein